MTASDTRATTRTGSTASAGERRRGQPERFPIHRLTLATIQAWLDDACIDAFEDDGQLCVRVGSMRMTLKLDEQLGHLQLSCTYPGPEPLSVDPIAVLQALNAANTDAVLLRSTITIAPDDDGEPDPDTGIWTPELVVMHECRHFAVDGSITRRQLLRLVRDVVDEARSAQTRIMRYVESHRHDDEDDQTA